MGRAFEYRRASKEKRWDKMSKIFPKLGKAITLAAREGVLDPAMNPRLRTAIANAKAQNMPKDNITAAIKRASSKDGNLLNITYEGKANYGVLIYIECLSDNPTRTIANIKSYFNKTPGASILVNGSIEFMFSHVSAFEIILENKDIEEIELVLIDYGLTSLEHIDDSVYVAYGEREDFGNLNSALESLNIEIKSAKLVRIPTIPIMLNESQMQELDKLLDKLEEDDDVIEIFTNIE